MSTAPAEIVRLVKQFREHRDNYRQGDYKETQLRRDFLDPFFAALGWDVHNRQGYAEAYRDVIHEDALRVEKTIKAPDYAFRIGPVRKFFVEAKRPSVDIRGDATPAFQLRRYAWTAKLSLSILTDFEELAVYDCRVKPDKNDKASTARIKIFEYTEYVDRWDEIAGIFSREAILRGSFDKFAQSTKKKRGTAEVDDAFLAEIESWREALARNLSLRNERLSDRELNFAVQRIIDRVIFLRMCEGRGIEPFGQLPALLNGPNVYSRLVELFHRADEKYNSGLFHFQPERGREPPDELTTALIVDDKVLKDIVSRLYYPESPYEFAALPADILGQVYEQFLGKVIRLTAGHRAKVEEKPEVRKAGGVYYTPTYIVEYIVNNTVGKLVEGKTAQEIGGLTNAWKPSKSRRPLSVLDPACGSGSFLIVAYQFLLDWYLKQYTEQADPKKHAHGASPRVYQFGTGDWRLTTSERKRILLSHIFGVDIDYQAVEVTKLSLLLKVLEGETEETLQRQRKLFHKDRALPDLANNIKCGNSLIGPDFYQGQQMSLLDEGERLRINVFDWNGADGFRSIMQSGGFDAVIGNPPYIRIQTMRDTAPQTIDYYKQWYAAASKGNYDIYVLFVERGLHILHSRGRLGFILPHKFFNAQYGRSLRQLVAEGRHLAHVVHFTDEQVFKGATTYTCLMFLTKSPIKMVDYLRVTDLDRWRTCAQAERAKVPANRFTSDDWNITIGPAAELLARLTAMPTKLGDIAERMAQGIRTSANEVYVLDIVTDSGAIIGARSKQLGREVRLERDSVSLFLQGREIKPYRIHASGKVVIIPYERHGKRTTLIREADYKKRFPKTYAYLQENKAVLEQRENGRMHGANWHAFIYPKNIDVMESAKILVPDIADRAAFALDERGEYAFTSGYGITLRAEVRESTKYMLGLLNSRVLDFHLKRISTTLRGGFFRYFTQYIAQLPIRTIADSDCADRTRHDRMVDLVEQMLHLHQRVGQARTAHDKTAIGRQIDATDRQIDQLVYELYGLSDDEIRLVEEATER